MEVKETGFEGLFEIHPTVFNDERGNFFENYNEGKLKSHNISSYFPLEFQSLSKKGVIRGLHFQKHPFAQGKLVRVVRGSVLDIVVDLRKNAGTYKQWKSFHLSDKNNAMLWIPVGFAHGFLALEENTIMTYKLTAPYHKDSEGGIIWNDSELNIDWQLEKLHVHPIVSEKDQKHPTLKDAYSF